ncbi:enhancer of yellow 2 transcription factor-like protein B [Radiomyces spectabilis]|uniref:enhancer of yellow 2 transcription factor-like protein B n=1 Tax=Radiomyces spectabilis TaxID=64574 RepID=UPI002220602E|nr:enhancer of yellow 2 transcription factor-like protein B [Radiomyces spectabilis]KAI8394297.1 enhancer of yellow 2 transcription factor-like protein B [Radiomyces spectabilis]
MSDAELSAAAINRHFTESGHKAKLLQLLKTRLVESGWNDSLYAHCRETLKNRKLENITLEELAAETSDFGRVTVNESIKKELLTQIKQYLDDTLE